MRQIDILEDIFTNQISVINVATPTHEATLGQARRICADNNFDVHLVRNSESNDLRLYERETDTVRLLVDYEVVSECTPILDVMELLLVYPQVFVKVKRNVKMIVSRADLDSIPVRIWLFGMISLLEVELRDKIRSMGNDWQQSLSEGRLSYARDLFAKKQQRNEEVEMLDCLQIVDLSCIVTRQWDRFQSQFAGIERNEFSAHLKDMNQLRDELAHAQKLTPEWNEIFELMVFVRKCLSSRETSQQ
ncbi:MAG: hypothetical protein JNL22_14100 [Bacteroidales bacterium]|nr:hypothetical protein [Bacteroidales bacterium]